MSELNKGWAAHLRKKELNHLAMLQLLELVYLAKIR